MQQVIDETAAAVARGAVAFRWDQSGDRPGYGRPIVNVPLAEATFDQLFNGRSGYRAQYYLSPEEGILFNRDLLAGLWPVLHGAALNALQSVPIKLVDSSWLAPHAKLWVAGELQAFDEAQADTLNPERWVANGATRGRKAPLPVHGMIELKGTFIEPATSELFIDAAKLDRACDIFNRGFT